LEVSEDFLGSLVALYADMGRYDRALPFLEQALNILQKALPARHPYILNAQQGLKNLRQMMEQ
jgi:tetratricopeptide (TPR) repeat protein